MTYLYRCDKCKKEIEIIKPISECNKEEHCETCGTELNRIYQSAAIFTADGAKY